MLLSYMSESRPSHCRADWPLDQPYITALAVASLLFTSLHGNAHTSLFKELVDWGYKVSIPPASTALHVASQEAAPHGNLHAHILCLLEEAAEPESLVALDSFGKVYLDYMHIQVRSVRT